MYIFKSKKLSVSLTVVSMFVLGLVFAAGCGSSGGSGGSSALSATVNGYTIQDAAQGKVNFNVSALNSSKGLVTGTITNPQVSNLTASGTGITSLNVKANNLMVSGAGAITGTANVCGDITSQGDLTSAITLDSTGSMSSSDPNNLRGDAARQFISRMAGLDKASLSSFDTSTAPTSGYLAIHIWQDFTSDKTLLDQAVTNAVFAGGSTNLWDAAYDSANLLATVSGANKVSLIFTDGYENSSSKLLTDAISQAQANKVRVYTVGLGSDCSMINCTDLQNLAASTGGTFAIATDPTQLQTQFDNMFNATKASGCINVQFSVNSAPPVAGTTISGTVSFEVNNQSTSGKFTVAF